MTNQHGEKREMKEGFEIYRLDGEAGLLALPTLLGLALIHPRR
jgi:hypothetical protein